VEGDIKKENNVLRGALANS